VTWRQILLSRMSVSCDQECLSGDDFSKTILSVRSEKRVSRRGFEKSKPLNLYSSYPGPSASHNRSISRNERSDTLDPCIKSSWSSIVQIQLPSFPFGCYTNPFYKKGVREDGSTVHRGHEHHRSIKRCSVCEGRPRRFGGAQRGSGTSHDSSSCSVQPWSVIPAAMAGVIFCV
jgi:hypothetical protein